MGRTPNDDRSDHFNPTSSSYHRADYNNPDHVLYDGNCDDDAITAGEVGTIDSWLNSAGRPSPQSRPPYEDVSFQLEHGDGEEVRITVLRERKPYFCMVNLDEGDICDVKDMLEREFPGARATIVQVVKVQLTRSATEDALREVLKLRR